VEVKAAAAFQMAFDADPGSHPIHQQLHDRETEAGAPGVVQCVASPVEAIEDQGEIGIFDTDALVVNADPHPLVPFLVEFHRDW
jgi:hypothetical protein